MLSIIKGHLIITEMSNKQLIYLLKVQTLKINKLLNNNRINKSNKKFRRIKILIIVIRIQILIITVYYYYFFVRKFSLIRL